MIEVTTTLSGYEMADLLNLLEDVARGCRLSESRQRVAKDLRSSIIAGTPESQRVSG